jgi:8-oxo-dGTP diphosphatase
VYAYDRSSSRHTPEEQKNTYLPTQERREICREFPGGKLETGETTEQCIRRELYEELSIEIHSIERIKTEAAYYKDGGIFNVAYCFISGFVGEPQNNVFEQICWVTLDELKLTDLLEGNKSFVEHLT